MHKARKRFITYAVAAVAVLLAVLLTVINGVNFTMASEDADRVTARLAEGRGTFDHPGSLPPAGDFRRVGPMGPDSPEMTNSVRYFTYAFNAQGNARCVAFALSAVSEEEAESWARELLGKPGTGWSRTTYRYRVYEVQGLTYVTVIDQGRELLGARRILVISLVGAALSVLASYLVLRYVSVRLFRPLEDADRKQQRFITDAEKSFQVPLTVIHADVELLEQANGVSEETRSIDRQVRRMSGLVRELGALAVFRPEEMRTETLDLGELVRAAAEPYRPRFAERNVELRLEGVGSAPLQGDGQALHSAVTELLDNALKFGRTWTALTVTAAGGRVRLCQTGDTELNDRPADQIFDRFTRLENAEGVPGAGLGLWKVKEIVKAHNGRQSARVSGGVFTLEIDL